MKLVEIWPSEVEPNPPVPLPPRSHPCHRRCRRQVPRPTPRHDPHPLGFGLSHIEHDPYAASDPGGRHRSNHSHNHGRGHDYGYGHGYGHGYGGTGRRSGYGSRRGRNRRHEWQQPPGAISVSSQQLSACGAGSVTHANDMLGLPLPRVEVRYA